MITRSMNVAKSLINFNNNKSKSNFIFNDKKIQKKNFNNENELAMHNESLIIFRNIVDETFVFTYENFLSFDSNVDVTSIYQMLLDIMKSCVTIRNTF